MVEDMNKGYYIEKFYENGSIIISTNNYNEPLLVEEEDKLIGFRFFEVKSDGSIKYTNNYYFGERLTYNELAQESKNDFLKEMQLKCLERRGVKEAIFCKNAYQVIYDIKPEDKTIDEVKLEKSKEKARSIFINQVEFLNKVKDALEAHNNKVNITMEDNYHKLTDTKKETYIDDTKVIIRRYDLYIDEHILFTSFAIVNGKKLDIKNKETYIRLSDALNIIKPLYQEYPYLEQVINNYIIELWNKTKEDNKQETKPTKKESKHRKRK